MNRRFKMSIKTKVAILMASLVLTFAVFNLIASSSAVEMIKVGKMAGNEIIANVLAKTDGIKTTVNANG
jgi:sensor histidine kinase regulating citrate/malate metabolism